MHWLLLWFYGGSLQHRRERGFGEMTGELSKLCRRPETLPRWVKCTSRWKSAPEWESSASSYLRDIASAASLRHTLHHAHDLLTHGELWFHYGRIVNHNWHVYSFLGPLRGGANAGAKQGSRVCEVKPLRNARPWLLIRSIDSSRFLLSHGHPSWPKLTVSLHNVQGGRSKAANC